MEIELFYTFVLECMILPPSSLWYGKQEKPRSLYATMPTDQTLTPRRESVSARHSDVIIIDHRSPKAEERNSSEQPNVLECISPSATAAAEIAPSLLLLNFAIAHHSAVRIQVILTATLHVASMP
jgi:hypothetical protein